ncbi:SRPBCC domain-containing protein [Streptomyces sp. NPDC048417]|uniref:SRPBCC family protein n=1 Tax=Streptomyces sp. NPDC048417 TaxID=3155387 RepID=UPI003427C33B
MPRATDREPVKDRPDPLEQAGVTYHPRGAVPSASAREGCRALAEPDPLVQGQMQRAGNFVLRSVTGTGRPRPRVPTPLSGVVDVQVLARDPERRRSVQWADPDPANLAHWNITWTLEHQGRGTRLFLVHEGLDPDDPAQVMARKNMDGDRPVACLRSSGADAGAAWVKRASKL